MFVWEILNKDWKNQFWTWLDLSKNFFTWANYRFTVDFTWEKLPESLFWTSPSLDLEKPRNRIFFHPSLALNNPRKIQNSTQLRRKYETHHSDLILFLLSSLPSYSTPSFLLLLYQRQMLHILSSQQFHCASSTLYTRNLLFSSPPGLSVALNE